MALFEPALTALAEAEGVLKRSMLTWQRAEDARVAAERAEQERIARIERERLQREAAEATAAGDVEKAELATELARVVSAPVAMPEAPRVKGVSTVKRWTYRIKDLQALIRYVSEHPEYQSCVGPVGAEIGRLATTMKDRCPLAGVEVYEEETIAARRSA